MAAPIPDEAPVTRATVMSIPNCSADTSLHGVTTWYLTAGDLIALHGHLYLPANGQWADVPALPVPKAEAIFPPMEVTLTIRPERCARMTGRTS